MLLWGITSPVFPTVAAISLFICRVTKAWVDGRRELTEVKNNSIMSVGGLTSDILKRPVRRSTHKLSHKPTSNTKAQARESESTPSIHPSFFSPTNPGFGCRSGRLIPDIPLPRSTSQLLLGNPEAFPGQKRNVIPSATPKHTSLMQRMRLGTPLWSSELSFVVLKIPHMVCQFKLVPGKSRLKNPFKPLGQISQEGAAAPHHGKNCSTL